MMNAKINDKNGRVDWLFRFALSQLQQEEEREMILYIILSSGGDIEVLEY